MSKPSPLYTLCVLALLAYHPPPALAYSSTALERVVKHQPRQLFGGFFGSSTTLATGTGTDTAATTGAATTTGTTAATTSSSSVPAISIPLIGASSSASTSSAAASASIPPSTASSASTAASTAPSSASSTSPTSSESKKSESAVIVTITSILTNADGSQSTLISASSSAVPASSGDSSGLSGKTWGIIGGVVGGVVVVIGALLLVWRCTQRRFSDLDHNIDEIKWPELQPDGQTVSTGLSTLNPQGTRRTGGAGFEMEKDRDDGSEWGDESPRLGGMRGQNASFEQPYEQPYEAMYGGQAGVGGQQQQQRGSYYDPYLGPTAAPYPPPPNIVYPPSHGPSPYIQYEGNASSQSFSTSPHVFGSSEDVPLTHPLESVSSGTGGASPGLAAGGGSPGFGPPRALSPAPPGHAAY
ncbi:hypothetical protein JCM5296_001515 [Sporobolomyces johnsonii]